MTATTSTYSADLLVMDDDAFEALVNEEIRDKFDKTTGVTWAQANPGLKAALRKDQLVLRRWYVTIMLMHRSLEGQFAAKTADNTAKVKKLQAGGAARAKVLTEEASFEQWRAGALRVKNGLEMRLIEVKSLLEARGDLFIIDRTAEERNAALARAGVLEEAIRRHKAAITRDEPDQTVDASDADLMLWSYLGEGS